MPDDFDVRVAKLSERKRLLLQRLRQQQATVSVPAGAQPAGPARRTIDMRDFYAGSGPAERGSRRASNRDGGHSSLLVLKQADPASPMYCCHAISGSPYSYLPFTRLLPQRQTVYGFEAPGMEGEAAPMTELTAMAAAYVAEIGTPPERYHLLGWSMGGFVAFEMACQLAERGRPPASLIMIDSEDPGPVELPGEEELLDYFMTEIAAMAGRPSVRLALDGSASTEEQLAQLFTQAVAAGVLAADLPTEFFRRRYLVFRANMSAMFGYRPRRYPGRVVMIEAEREQDRVGWEPYAAGGLRRIAVPGDHYSIWGEQSLPILVDEVVRLCR